MRVSIRRQPWADLIAVYVIEDAPPRALARVGDGYEWTPFVSGEEPPSFVVASAYVMEAVAVALTELAPALPATEDALRDARTTRDWALRMVERLLPKQGSR